MTDANVAELAARDPAAWIPAAGRLLANLGFSLINSDRPDAPGGSNLLVALRDRPTLRHFDPELVRVWVARDGRGRPLELIRATRRPLDLEVEWGHIHVVDRLGVENRFQSFGGRLRMGDADPRTTVIVLHSPGPVVRWGGHSQGTDPLAEAMGAFFGRLIIPVEMVLGAERELAEIDPRALYAAFLRSEGGRRRRALANGAPMTPLDGWLSAEAARVAARDPAAWASGGRLLADLGLT